MRGRSRRLLVAVTAVLVAGCGATSTSPAPAPAPAPAPGATSAASLPASPPAGSTAPAPAGPTVPAAGTEPAASASTGHTSDSAASAGTGDAAPPAVTTSVATLAPGVSDEASGLVASTRTPGAWLLVDDATGTDSVAVVSADGALLGRIDVAGMSADNAEAMASGTCGPIPLPDDVPAENCVYVGDIGDNAERRADVAVSRFAEPDLAEAAAGPVPADEWHYTYPDGPHNAESIMLAPDGSLLLVTKPAGGDLPHRMYRADPGGGELVFVSEFRPPGAERPLRTLFTGTVVTDLAYTPGRVLLLTYDEALEFTAPDPAADPASFPDWPHRRLTAPSLSQAEGIASTADGCGYAVASEGGPGGGPGSLAVMSCP